MILKYYTLPALYETWVETFNKRPNRFDYHAFLRSMKDDAGKDNIIIQDKKSEMRRDAYGPIIATPPGDVAAKIMKNLHTPPSS